MTSSDRFGERNRENSGEGSRTKRAENIPTRGDPLLRGTHCNGSEIGFPDRGGGQATGLRQKEDEEV